MRALAVQSRNNGPQLLFRNGACVSRRDLLGLDPAKAAASLQGSLVFIGGKLIESFLDYDVVGFEQWLNPFLRALEESDELLRCQVFGKTLLQALRHHPVGFRHYRSFLYSMHTVH
jgi:hypothetical protein